MIVKFLVKSSFTQVQVKQHVPLFSFSFSFVSLFTSLPSWIVEYQSRFRMIWIVSCQAKHKHCTSFLDLYHLHLSRPIRSWWHNPRFKWSTHLWVFCGANEEYEVDKSLHTYHREYDPLDCGRTLLDLAFVHTFNLYINPPCPIRCITRFMTSRGNKISVQE